MILSVVSLAGCCTLLNSIPNLLRPILDSTISTSNPTSNLPSSDFVLTSESNRNLIKVAQCADMLQNSMPEMFESHDQRLKVFLDGLRIAFPDTTELEWYVNVSPRQNGSEKVDLVYRYKESLVAIIFTEVKLEPGQGGDPFWQNGRAYRLYIEKHLEKNPKVWENGAPVFFIQLSGTKFIHSWFDVHVLTLVLLQVSTWQ